MSNETQTPTTQRIPAPLYALAGAGDLAYQQLRKLPAVVADLQEKAPVAVAQLRGRATDLSGKAVAGSEDLRVRTVQSLKAAQAQATATAGTLRERAAGPEGDVTRLTEVAKRNAAAFLAVAQTRAVETYVALVAHGERVVGTGVVQAADAVNADMEATEAPAQVTATPADVAEAVETPAPKKRTAKKAAPAAE